MGWALLHITKLKLGKTVSFRPKGNSMQGKIESGQLCTVQPCEPNTLEVGDVVLCKVKGREFLHKITAMRGAQFQIGNNKGRLNGWISANAIFGKCIEVTD
jgi:SOS-response transcriptional repressor LexA